ncbi:MAG TPA: hypothetical protein VNJ12_06995 [Candidatus Dormibacteraeota bacterium]|nr:hypothetical protein [Candidatus Dormibacteraeota bacterium]
MTNPLASPANYPEMLNKISIWTFVSSFALTLVVGAACPAAAHALGKYHVRIDVYGGIAVPLMYIVPPVVISVVFRIVRLHDKISDRFAIRQNFDVFHILLPLAGTVGYALDLDRLEVLKKERRQLMNKTFYRYASSTEPKIQRHLITRALDNWSWYWILIEFLVIGTFAFFFLLLCGAYHAAAWLGAALLLLTPLGIFGGRFCVRAADAEVREILANADRCREIKAVFDALYRPG